MTIGERIKLRREQLGLTQEEVALKCGYKSRSSVNKIELSRDLPLRKVELMAKALETTPSYLMGWENINNELEIIDEELVENIFKLQQTDENDIEETERIQGKIAELEDRHRVASDTKNKLESDLRVAEYELKRKEIEEVKKAQELYNKYLSAPKNIQDAVNSLLKGTD